MWAVRDVGFRALLYSTKILLQLSTKISVPRDWRVVSVPEEDSKVIDFMTLLYSTKILLQLSTKITEIGE